MTSPPGRGKPPRPPDSRQGRVDDAEPLAAALPQDRVRQQGRTQDAAGRHPGVNLTKLFSSLIYECL
jgi:hypothetical protein